MSRFVEQNAGGIEIIRVGPPKEEVSKEAWRSVAHLDEKTCDMCRDRNGQVFDGRHIQPPYHPNCRCRKEKV